MECLLFLSKSNDVLTSRGGVTFLILNFSVLEDEGNVLSLVSHVCVLDGPEHSVLVDLLLVFHTAGDVEVVEEFVTNLLLLYSHYLVVGNLVLLSHGSVLFLVLLFQFLGAECLDLSLVHLGTGTGAEGEASEFRDLLKLLERLSEHGVEADGALLFVSEGTSRFLTVDNENSTESIPSSSGGFVRYFVAGSLAELEDFNLVSLKLIVLLVNGDHLSLPLEVVGVGCSLGHLDFTSHDQEGTPNVFRAGSHAFSLADGEQFTSRRPADVLNLLRGMEAEGLDLEAGVLILVALVEIDTSSHGSVRVVSLACFNFSLGVSVNRETSVDRLPLDSIEIGDITVNGQNLVRDTVRLSEVKHFDGALVLSLDQVIVLNSEVLATGMHVHAEFSRSSEGGKAKVLLGGDL